MAVLGYSPLTSFVGPKNDIPLHSMILRVKYIIGRMSSSHGICPDLDHWMRMT